MTTFYLGGPMRGHDRYNFPAFDRAVDKLRQVDGYVVLSPAEHDRETGFDETLNTLDGFDFAAAFAWDLASIEQATGGVIFLPGWERSAGCAAEYAHARSLGRIVYAYRGADDDTAAPYGFKLDVVPVDYTPEVDPLDPANPEPHVVEPLPVTKHIIDAVAGSFVHTVEGGPTFIGGRILRDDETIHGSGRDRMILRVSDHVDDAGEQEQGQWRDPLHVIPSDPASSLTVCAIGATHESDTETMKNLGSEPRRSPAAHGTNDSPSSPQSRSAQGQTDAMSDTAQTLDPFKMLDSDDSSASASTSTTACSPSKTDAAPSAEKNRSGRSASPSITTTNQVECEESSAKTAIRASATFETTEDSLGRPMTISVGPTGGRKQIKDARFDLLPQIPLWRVAELYARGAEKYADHNWRKGYDWSLSFAALQRHAWLFWSGEDLDPETGCPHLASVVFHAFAMLEWAETHPELDDRYRGA